MAGQGQSSQVPPQKAGGSNSSGTNKCGASSLNGSLASYKIGGSEQSWPQAPVYSKVISNLNYQIKEPPYIREVNL